MGRLTVGQSAAFVLAGLLAGCATRPPAPPPAPAPAPRTEAPQAPRPSPVYKVGSPYQVNGVWYYPREQPDYDETGIASWYGYHYNGRLTANGEVFDPNAITGAHPTLPMPVNVRVTNLENGRSIVVRVNDRGPYVNGRIIDLSERAAELLGFRIQGLARVRVTYLGRADLYGPGLASPAQQTPPEIASAIPAVPVARVESGSLPPLAGIREAPRQAPPSQPAPASVTIAPPLPQAADGEVITLPVPRSTAIYVQAGAFASAVNAAVLAARLTSLGARVDETFKDGRSLYRVRIGPFQAVSEADAALARVQALGHNDVQIVVDSVRS